VAFFTQHHLTIQIGFTLLLILLGGAAMTNGLVGYQMKRMSVGSVFAYGYIGGMSVGALPGFLLVTVCFLTAAFRPDRNPALISLLYDLDALLQRLVGLLHSGISGTGGGNPVRQEQNLPEMVCLRVDLADHHRSDRDPDVRLRIGPFAWNGSIAFWLAVVVFSVWLGALIVLLRGAARQEPLTAAALA
jgi:hypothetical protein